MRMSKLRGIAAVLLLSSMTMWAQSAPAADSSKPDEHAACKRDKNGNKACCKKDKNGKMTGDCCKHAKKDAEKKS